MKADIPGMTARTEVHEIIDLPCGGSTLRLALIRDGSDGRLLIAHGFDSGSAFHRPAWCTAPLTIPATAIPELRAALDVLAIPSEQA
ncbi:MAG: hypothetical protein O2956_13755 [Gemmatimonadetes bacterium]|nr:hypothetical protein [Gemmatimonadota bacterium]